MYFLEFTKTISNLQKLEVELKSLNSKYASLYCKGDYLQLKFSSNLTQIEVDEVSFKVNNFIEVSITEELKQYVETIIRPFVEDLLFRIQAENIELGITQAGKTLDVLGFFEQQVLLPNKTRSVSFKGSLDTNSLTVTIDLLSHFIANPGLYSDLSPFVTPERLADWRSTIITKLSS